MINSDRLTAFVAFAECLNFTRAAEQLHISQPALHVQVRKLGESLSAQLYVRRGRALELTVEGQKLLAFAREQLERDSAFVEGMRGGAHVDVVTLAAGEGTFMYLLGDAIKRFQHASRAKLCVLTRDRDQALDALRLGQAQLAVTVVDEEPAGFVARPVARVGAAVVLPKTHRLAGRRSLSIAELDGEPLIAPAEGRPQRAMLAKAWREAGATWKPAVEANGWELILHFARLGLGIAVVNDFCRPPTGMIMKPLRGLPRIQYQLLRRRERVCSDAVTALERTILEG